MVSAAEAGGRVFGSMGGGLDSDEVRRFFTSCIFAFWQLSRVDRSAKTNRSINIFSIFLVGRERFSVVRRKRYRR